MMGTYAELCAPAKHSDVIRQGFERLKAVELALSSYDPRADIYRLNRDRNVTLQPDTYEALLKSIRYYHESGGAFNIAIGSVTRGLYRFGERDERIPSSEALLKADTDLNGLVFDAETAEIEAGIRLDLGGMGKGFGVDKAYRIYRQHGVVEGKIALSGDIRCIGTCEIAVTDPFRPEGIIASMKSVHPGLGISTSGNYRRYVRFKEHHHLIDPETKKPAEGFASVTLLGYLSNADLDAYATAASVMQVEEALSFLKRFDIAFLLYTTDRRQIRSNNLDAFVIGFSR